MKISICTLTARRGYAEQMLHMIADQDFDTADLEWILIDFVYEERVSTLKELAKSRKLSLTHLPNVRDHKLFFRDITRNRNKALGAATGDFVIFLDDYAVIDKSFVKNHLEILSQGCLSAGNMHRRELPTDSSVFNLTNNAFETILSKDSANIGKDYRDRNGQPYVAQGISYTGNLGIPRIVFETLNGFDPRMESGLEDCDFGIRAGLANFTCMFNPKAATINLDVADAPYTYSFDHPHDVEPFICNPNNNFAGDANLTENDYMKVFFDRDNKFRIACCKICGATGMIDPNELIQHKQSIGEFRVPDGLPGAYS